MSHEQSLQEGATVTSRSRRTFVRGLGSIMDIGGTNYKKSPVYVVKRGSLASDRRAIARDVNRAVRSVTSTPKTK